MNKKTDSPKKLTPDEIANLADQGKDISGYFSNDGKIIELTPEEKALADAFVNGQFRKRSESELYRKMVLNTLVKKH